MASLPRLLTITCGIAACSSTAAPDHVRTLVSEGVVAGFARDSAGRGVREAKVCATTVVQVHGGPLLMSNLSSTSADGGYLIEIGLQDSLELRAGVAVTATPPTNSGLESKLSPRLELIITATQPPPETTYVDLVLAKASPGTGASGGKQISCFY